MGINQTVKPLIDKQPGISPCRGGKEEALKERTIKQAGTAFPYLS